MTNAVAKDSGERHGMDDIDRPPHFDENASPSRAPLIRKIIAVAVIVLIGAFATVQNNVQRELTCTVTGVSARTESIGALGDGGSAYHDIGTEQCGGLTIRVTDPTVETLSIGSTYRMTVVGYRVAPLGLRPTIIDYEIVAPDEEALP